MFIFFVVVVFGVCFGFFVCSMNVSTLRANILFNLK